MPVDSHSPYFRGCGVPLLKPKVPWWTFQRLSTGVLEQPILPMRGSLWSHLGADAQKSPKNHEEHKGR